jgi:hypothetical protein
VQGAIEKHDDFFAKDEAAFRAYLAYVRRNPACVRLGEEVRLHHPKLYDETNAMWLTMFRDAIHEGIERGRLRVMRDDEVWVLAYLLLGARYFVDQMILAAGRKRVSDETMVAAYVNLTRNGLARARAAAGRVRREEHHDGQFSHARVRAALDGSTATERAVSETNGDGSHDGYRARGRRFSHCDHRCGLRRHRHGDPPEAGRDRVVHDVRARRRDRRHVARQHLSGRRVRRAFARILAFVRAEARLEP